MRLTRTLWLVCVTLLACGLLFATLTTETSATRVTSGLSQEQMARRDSDLDRVFRRRELLSLDAATLAREVRRTGRVSLVAGDANYDLVLMPNDMRSPSFRAEATYAGGVRRELERAPVRTYKGFVSGMDGALARFSIDEQRVEGFILMPDGERYIEPAARYSAAAGPNDYVLYQAADVIEGASTSCGWTLDQRVEKAKREVAQPERAPDAAPLPLLIVELATEADSEYVAQAGGVDAANLEILDIMNVVDVIYRQHFALTFQINFMHAWGTPDPFNDSNAPNLLFSFRDYWNANFANVQRDLTHLWSGSPVTALSGVTIVGQVCVTGGVNNAYGIRGRVTEAPQKFALSAHEIGHSLGAPAAHPDTQPGCANTIMSSGSGPSTQLIFCAASVTSISTFINSHTSCMTPVNATTRFDFDGDFRADLSVFRNSTGTWYVTNSATGGLTALNFGAPGDLAAPEDFDGDGRTDFGVFRPSTGVWYLQQTSAGFRGQQFGTGGDRPVSGDYDGDRKADIAVYRPSTGAWYIYNSGNGSVTGLFFGAVGDVPAPADFDGDGRFDIAVFRPSNGTWYMQQSRNGFRAAQFGAGGDRPVPADYDGDNKADLAIFRPLNGTWYLMPSTAGGPFSFKTFGTGNDTPAPADFDGDGNTDIGVWRPGDGTWYILQSGSGHFGNGSFRAQQFGASGDTPAPSAYIQ